MKSNSGLTITSIIVYIIAMVIVIGTIATISSFFYTNVSNLDENSNNLSEITKFHMYFLQETTNLENSIVQQTDTSISFDSGNTFTFQNHSIYFNYIKICDNISNLQFASEVVNDKVVINVLITLGQNNEYTKTTKYVLNSTM